MNTRQRLSLAAASCFLIAPSLSAENNASLATFDGTKEQLSIASICTEHSLIAAGMPFSPPASPPSNLVKTLPLPASKNPSIEPIQSTNQDSQTVKGTVEYSESSTLNPDVPALPVVNALNEALINSPRAAAIRAQFAIARANYARATMVINPYLMMDRGLVAEQEMRIGPVLTFEPPWKLVFRMLATARLVAQTKIDLLTVLWQLRADTRRAYMEVVVAEETLRTLEQLYDISSKLLSVTSKRFQTGDVPELDMLKARLANSQTVVELGVGRVRLIRARQQLNVIMGRPVHTPINIPGLPDYTGSVRSFKLSGQLSEILPSFEHLVAPLRDYIAIALDNRLELKSLEQQIKLNKVNLKGAYGNAIPNPCIAFGKSTAGNVPTGPKITAVFFTLNAPTILGNVNQGKIVNYKAEARQLKYQVGSQKNLIIGQVSAAYQTLMGAREKLRVYQEHVLADSYEVARLARRSYEVGQSSITATLQAQQINVQIRSQYLDAVMSYTQAFTDLEQACGKPLQ